MARFVVECHYPAGQPRREVHVTSSSTPMLNGQPLGDGGEVEYRGRRWSVRLVVGGDNQYVLRPLAAG